jgi:Na+-driven multidrug efflux pump
MTFLFTLLIAGLMLAVVVVLAKGIIGLFRGNDPARSNKLMQLRVLLQFAVLVVFVIFVAITRK